MHCGSFCLLPSEISEANISDKMIKPNETTNFLVLMAAQIESSGWENNTERVSMAAFSRLSLLTRNFNRKISINQNMATHSQCLLMSGAVQRRYYCIFI